MTILSESSRMSYTGNGAVSEYSFTYKIFNEDELLVTVRHPTTGVETELTLTTDYTVDIASNRTGSITLVNASQAWLTSGFLTTSWILVIRRVVDITQETDIKNQGTYYPESHENAFDHMVMISQQLKDELSRSIKVAETDDPLTFTLPTSTERASTFLAFDADGEPIASPGETSVPVSTYIETLLDDTDAATARATLGFSGTGGTADTAQIADGAVTSAKMANMSALSVKGNATNGSTVPTDIAASSDYTALRRSGTAIAFGKMSGLYMSANVVSKTANYTSTDNDEIIYVDGSSAAFAITLHTPSYNQRLTIIRTETTLANAVSITGTINGATDWTLNTINERYVLLYDSTNGWRIIEHEAETEWTSGGAITFTGESVNPTKGTTRQNDIYYWRRSGKNIFLNYKYSQSSNAGAAAGTGNYIIALPVTVDTAIIPAFGAAITNGFGNIQNLSSLPCSILVSNGGAHHGGSAFLRTSTSFSILLFSNQIFGPGIIAINEATISYSFKLGPIPVSGWKD